MSVIQFLERIAVDPDTGAAGYAEAVQALDADPAVRDALLGRDAGALNRLLDGRARMWCLIATPDDAPGEDAPVQPDGDDDERDPPARQE